MRLAFAVLAWLLVAVWSARANADEYVIEEGRERDVLALFAPYELGGPIAGGWLLHGIGIEPTRIVVEILGPSEARAEMVLVHQSAGKGDRNTPSFAILRGEAPDADARRAQALLEEAVARNDDGKFWRAIRPLPIGRAYGRGPPRLGGWLALDGVVLLGGLVLAVFTLAARALVGAPAWVKLSVPSVFLAGIGLRLAWAPASQLGAWPWSRMGPHARSVFESPVFGALADRYGVTLHYTDVALAVGLLYASLMPLVLYAHATQLLRDARAGAFAAFAVAFSPHHIRFSRCEDAFVPSLVLTSTAFALLHTFLRDRARAVRLLAVAALPVVLWPAYLLRPLNILFVGVFVWAALALHPEESTRLRRFTAAIVAAGVGALALRELDRTQAPALHDAASTPWVWLARVPRTLVDPELNVLLQPALTSPVLLVLGGAGLWSLKRGDRRLARFLVVWLATFFVAHAYVVDAPMQPRYHLHLLVPLLLAAAAGAVDIASRSRAAVVLACGCLAVTPVLARTAIADVSRADQREYAFVRRLRDVVPDGCSVVEYVGDEAMQDARFARIGLRAAASPLRFASVAVRRSDGPEALAAAVSNAPGSCVYVYEGLACWGGKAHGEPYAPACAALDNVPGLEAVAEETFAPEVYERRVLAGLGPDVQEIRLRLRRRSAGYPEPRPTE